LLVVYAQGILTKAGSAAILGLDCLDENSYLWGYFLNYLDNLLHNKKLKKSLKLFMGNARSGLLFLLMSGVEYVDIACFQTAGDS
jgi:hypothetical protein